VKLPAQPKNYVRVPYLYSPDELAAWQREYPDHPTGYPPPRTTKLYFSELSGFNMIVRFFKDDPQMTARDIEEWGGGAYGGYGEAILAYLRSLPKL
jgi:hypothetical protein